MVPFMGQKSDFRTHWSCLCYLRRQGSDGFTFHVAFKATSNSSGRQPFLIAANWPFMWGCTNLFYICFNGYVLDLALERNRDGLNLHLDPFLAV